MMTQAQAIAKKNEIMDRIAAGRGTTRQALENRAKEIATEALIAIPDGGTYADLVKAAETIYMNETGIAWGDVEAELQRRFK